MQNFTLGKKGFSMLLFALILFSGTYSSYGQCPTVDEADSIQYFCDSQEAEVGDLTVTTTNGATVAWYDSQSSTTPIPATTYLVNGKTYYAGSTTQACVNSRDEVTVSIASEPEILGIRSSNAIVTSAQRKQSLAIIGICVADVNDPNVFIEDLRTNVESPDQVNWYYNRTSTEPIPAGTELQNNTDYFAARVSADGNCETNRRKTTVRFFSEAAPTGPATQDFCAIDNPTLGDIEASGDNRYFSTLTSQTELSPNTPLVDDRTYYISSVGENCESTERLAVTVNVIPAVDLGTPETGVVCELDVSETFPSFDAIRNYYLSLLPEGVSSGGTFSPTAEQIATQYQNDADGLGDFTTTYTLGCDQVDLTISIIPAEQANAGDDVTLQFTLNDGPQDLFSYLTSGAQTIGTFEGYPDGSFDPSTEGEGNYTVTYTVDETSGCIIGSDSAVFNITVAPCDDNAGADVDRTVCRSDAEAIALQLISAPSDEARSTILINWIGERDLGGVFSDDPATQLGTAYAIGEYPFTITTTYTVGEGVCEDSAEISITVVEDVDAGENGSVTLEQDDAPVNLFDYLGGTPDNNGTWSNGTGIFNPATDAAGTFTYTVGTEGCTDSADVVVSVTTDPTDPGNPGPGYAIVCSGDVDTFFPSYDEIRKFYLRLLPVGVPTTGTFNPTPQQISQMYQADADRLGEFTTVYTAPGGETYELTVNIVAEADAGEDASITVNENDATVDLFAELGPDAQKGGTWSSGNGTFNPATDEAGSFTYTVGYDGCMDSATVTVAVTTDPTDPCDIAGTPGYGVVCLADVDTTFPSFDEIRKYYLSLLDAGVPTNGTFNPTPAQISAQYQADADGLGEFTTTYTVTVGECTDTVELTVLITEEADAGENGSVTVSRDDAPFNLFTELEGTPQMGGTWSPGNGMFNPATDDGGVFTYTVGSGDCVDSATVTVTVTTDPTDPCEGVVDAGTDSSATVCETDVDTTFPSIDEIRKFYLNLLDPGVAKTGTLNPTAAQISAMYQADADGLGDFTTTYTLTSGECSDSVELTVTIVPTETASTGTISDATTCTATGSLNLFDLLTDTNTPGGTFSNTAGTITNGMLDVSQTGTYSITYTVDESDAGSCIEGTASTTFTVTVTANTANAGADNSVEVCNSEVENLSNAGVRNLYLDLLEDGVPTTGTFNPTIQQIIDQYNINSKFGDFTTTYTVGTGACTDSAVLTVTVLENPNAGENATVNLEEGATATVDLFDALGGTPDAGGVWTDADGATVDATFDPATEDEGVYTYTVTSDNGCSDTATVTVIIGDENPDCTILPYAPTVTNFTGCAGEDATVADLEITAEAGNTANVYTDETLETLAADTDALVNGTYYVTQVTDAGCESPAATLTVTLTASDAPTLTDTDCTKIDGTLADLEEQISANGTITWYAAATSTEPLSRTTALVDGTTYYVSSTTNGCESSRLAVTVDLCPMMIPEAFSPNNDTKNDLFVIKGLASQFPNYTLEIYNRWGEPVYKGNASTPEWDGTSSEGSFGSGVLPVGVYFYILYYNDGQTAPTQGRVYLSR